jgi:hypothetical protein
MLILDCHTLSTRILTYPSYLAHERKKAPKRGIECVRIFLAYLLILQSLRNVEPQVETGTAVKKTKRAKPSAPETIGTSRRSVSFLLASGIHLLTYLCLVPRAIKLGRIIRCDCT